MNSQKLGVLLASLCALSWSILAILLKYTLSFASPINIVWFRMAMSALGLGLFLYFRKKSHFTALKNIPKSLFIAGILLAINFVGFIKGVELTTASNSQIMIQMGPLLLALLGFFYFKESPKALQIVGFLLASLGFALFYWDQILISMNYRSQYLNGNLWILGAAISWAFFAAIQKKHSHKWTPPQMNTVIFIAASVSLVPFVKWNHYVSLSFFQWGLFLILAFISIFSYSTLGEALQRIPASHVSLIISVNPLLTLFLIQVLSKWNLLFIPYESVMWRGYLGSFFVVVGVIFTVIFKS